jgi:hypothetical protein
MFLLVEVGRIGAEGGRARGHSTAFLVGAGLLSLGERKFRWVIESGDQPGSEASAEGSQVGLSRAKRATL